MKKSLTLLQHQTPFLLRESNLKVFKIPDKCLGRLYFCLTLFIACFLTYDSFAAGCTPPGKGNTWCIEFNGAATKTGKVFFEWKATKTGGGEQAFDMDFDVNAGDTEIQKAQKLFNSLQNPPFNAHVNSCINGNTVCMRLKDPNTFNLADITDGKMKDQQTGQKNIRVYDPPVVPRTAVFFLEGIPQDPLGEANLQIGFSGPVITTSTIGKPVSQIISELITGFNVAYAGTGFVAEVCGPNGLAIPGQDDPVADCDANIAAGSTDTGLTYTVGLVEPFNKFVPTLSQWGLILLTLLLLTFSMVAILRRQLAFAGTGSRNTSEIANSKTPLFDSGLYWHLFPKLLLFVPVVLLLFYFVYGFITAADVFGTLVSAGIITYWIHFLLSSHRN